MEVGTEISQKIRSAIKAKLMEIGSYVDDELPDYIMVMVANKKTQQQMSNDLSLFLGTNTDVFTTWLHGLLVKLQTVSGDSSKTEKSKSSKDKKREKNKSKDGVESKKEKRKISKKSGDGEDSDMPKVKSARTTNVEKSGIDALQTKDTVSENITNNRLSENEALEQNGTKSVGDSKQDHDIEDVRQLLVTETPSDELAEELEKSEEGIDLEKLASSSRSSAAKNASSSLKSKETVDAVEHERPSSQEPHTDVASSSKKRKCPSSVVAAVKRDDGIEDDHSTPMVASVVKVTSRKSSFPQSMQANRALLVKAISEAERSIAVKRKIAVAKPISREESPSEIYTPKRRKSESSTAEVSPPPYIPSRKDSSSIRSKSSAQVVEPYGSSRDARQLLEKRERSSMLLPSRERRELISRSRRLELFHKLGIDRREVPYAGERRVKDDEEKFSDRKIERETSDVVRNFKITATVTPSSRLSQAAKERLAKALEEKERQLKITVLPSVSSHKGSLASRLGKVVVHQRSSEDREQNQEPRDKSKTHFTPRRQRLALTLLGKEVVKKQCEAAVLSVKSSAAKMFKQVETTDSRVVESHMSSDEESSQERSSVEIVPSRKERKDSLKSERDSLEKDSEDLDDMLKDDVETDLLNETLADEFTLDLDDDEDLIKVVGQLEEEDKLPVREKLEVSSGTRFIVTLDGVDERQFEGHRENEITDSGILSFNSSQLSSPDFQQAPVVPRPLDQATFILPSEPCKGLPILKSGPPKIQPFSINLKDSDDEYEDKAETKAFSKLAGYQHPVKPMVTGIVDPTISMEPTEGLTALQKAKLSERCKFWPACAAGSECKFHHPTSYCKTFPNCKFGDKCLFIHPNCKFDSKCTRIDCPFTHTSRRPALGAPSQPAMAPVPTNPFYPQYIPLNSTPPSTSTVCKFFPNCHNVNCSFIHPKPCRFGLSCQSPGCPFFHPSTPTKDKLKWTALTDQAKETMVTSPTQSSSKPQTLLTASSLAGSAAVSSTNMWLK